MHIVADIVDSWRKYYYTVPLMYLTELITIILGFLYAKKTFIGRLFLSYLLFDFILLNIAEFLEIKSTPKITFTTVTNSLVSLFELVAYYYFFARTLNNMSALKGIKFGFVVYGTLNIVYILTRWASDKTSQNYFLTSIPTFEFLLLIFPCIVYFRQLFIEDSTIDLFDRPSFWITTGVFFFSILSIPYYLTFQLLRLSVHSDRYIFGAFLFFLPFTINFVFLSKAFLCKKPLTI